jgi:hypothetical protein
LPELEFEQELQRLHQKVSLCWSRGNQSEAKKIVIILFFIFMRPPVQLFLEQCHLDMCERRLQWHQQAIDLILSIPEYGDCHLHLKLKANIQTDSDKSDYLTMIAFNHKAF